MSRMLFVNIPIANAAASRKFFDHLGFSFNDQFCDENTLCMAVNEQSWVMMLEHDRFRGFIADDIADTSKSREVLLCVSADSRAGVDELVDAALAAGGVDWMPAQELGFMYGRSFRDLDGHVWEVSWNLQ
ncbi:Possible glyoxalase/bleomycin resistance protein/ dioxygenase [Mycobacteroides abscessus subsp. abscessus]|nr:Possible glyoxalase/bleomycin resistance protein/ dioxygenase [Mycobacteroides abscessus subsp. abscessus]